MLLWSIEYILLPLLGMGAVAFITLLERKILGLSQNRMGPNKVSFSGLLQPVSDGVKLLTKESFRPSVSQELVFILSPVLLMAMFIMLWVIVLPWKGSVFLVKNSTLAFLCLLAAMAYSIIMAGWSSTSAYSKMGSMRGILQSLSYEVALIMTFLWGMVLVTSFSFCLFKFLTLEMSVIWSAVIMIFILMEGNRAPFDLLEGESELISGFNIEMGSLMFVYLFLSEYGMIIFMSLLITNLIMGYMSSLVSLLLMSLVLIFRSCYPRARYDSLMGIMWKSLLPLMTLLLSLVWCMK